MCEDKAIGCHVYKDVKMERIMKSGKMQVIKVNVSSEEDYNKALRNPTFYIANI